MAEKRRPPHVRDRLTFLLTLVPYLIDHDRVSVTDVAAHFEVTPDDVRAAVTLIAMSGIPGETGTYQHDDLFDIAWDDFNENDEIVLTHLIAIDDAPRFSGRETAALIAALQYLSALPETRDTAALHTLMAKLARSANTAATTPVAIEAAETDGVLADIRDALSWGVQLELSYSNAEGRHERRRVDPIRIESIDTDWYLRGWCHLRQALRTFRLDRISDLVVTEEPVSGAASSDSIPDTLFEGSPDDTLVTLDVVPAAIGVITDYLPPAATIDTVGDLRRVGIRVSHFHGLKRLVAGHPGMITVVEPPEARAAVAGWAHAGAARYNGN
ncbi:MAG TPA: WYL domain-containing protein [Terrimesophilobacter sp.]|nr:WYL domain-containing protein [Terrimesophilobacter sp.]